MNPPKLFKQTGPDQLSIAENKGCVALFGLPFFAAGILMMLTSIGIIPLQNADDVPSWSYLILFLMGVIFSIVGGYLAFGRTWIDLDKSRGTLVMRKGWLIPMRTTQYNLFNYNQIELGFVEGDSETVDKYPVRLLSSVQEKVITIYDSSEYGDSYERAIFIAKFLTLPLKDTTTQHTTTFKSDQLHGAFVERSQVDSAAFERIERPFHLVSNIEEKDDSTQITIPAGGFKLTLLLSLIIPAGILISVFSYILPFFRQTHTPILVQHIAIGFIVVMFVIVPLISFINSVLAKIYGYSRLITSSTEIKIIERGAWRSRTKLIAVHEIIDIDFNTVENRMSSLWDLSSQHSQYSEYGSRNYRTQPRWQALLAKYVKSKGIIIKTTTGLFTFAAGLPDDEVRYLWMIVKRALIRK
ncbi:hypothetical protein JW960_04575 [candidate division KSB1 bacterium]|nr:hypothetical protein [candidate division KSB1 bacterium]